LRAPGPGPGSSGTRSPRSDAFGQDRSPTRFVPYSLPPNDLGFCSGRLLASSNVYQTTQAPSPPREGEERQAQRPSAAVPCWTSLGARCQPCTSCSTCFARSSSPLLTMSRAPPVVYPIWGAAPPRIIGTNKRLDAGATKHGLGSFGGDTIGEGANADRFSHQTSRRSNVLAVLLQASSHQQQRLIKRRYPGAYHASERPASARPPAASA